VEKYYGWGLPLDISKHGAAIDRLINVLHVFMIVLFVGWFVFLVYTLVKYRARPGHKATYDVHHFKAPTYLEVFVALFEVVLLVGFSFPIWHQYKNVPPPKDKAFEVRIVAEQFAWNVHYPGADRQFGKTSPKLMGASNPVGLDKSDPAAADDVVAINQLHVPVNTPVIAHLTSKDVIHSFFLPVARVKQDTIPGQEIPVWFETTKTGKFEIACAQLCGLGHYRMRGFFLVDSQEDFNKWFLSKVAK
jgi:cytochrome c oxidase subunit 2